MVNQTHDGFYAHSPEMIEQVPNRSGAMRSMYTYMLPLKHDYAKALVTLETTTTLWWAL